MKDPSSEKDDDDILEQKVQKLLEKKGRKALELAKETVLEEQKRIECKEVREALNYFISEYWNDIISPTLIALGCEAVGGDATSTVPIAVPVILISGAVDIHDDVIDKSKTKYNRLTVFGKYGKEIALLVGDALLFEGLTSLQEAAKHFPQKKLLNIIDVIKNAFFELGDAEASELKFRNNLQITPEDYLATMHKKAADVEGLLRIGATIGDGSIKQIEALGGYGRIIGLLIILKDDWIDTIDYEEAIHRIQSESLPLPFLYIIQNQRARKEISQILEKDKLKRQDFDKLLKITKKRGGFEETKKAMLELKDKALEYLPKANLKYQNLELLIDFLVDVA